MRLKNSAGSPNSMPAAPVSACRHASTLASRKIILWGGDCSATETVADKDERLFGERFGWYAALDLSTLEERDWRVDAAAQGGLTLPIGRRTHRFGVEIHDGRVPLGEFYQTTETYVALGVWIDIDY